jgi:uncharacterized membrane protein YkoI
MKSRITLTVAMIATICLSSLAIAKESEDKVSLSDCPAAVQATIQSNLAGGQIQEIEKETTKDGTVIYEAEVKLADGKKVDVKVSEDGKLLDNGEE